MTGVESDRLVVRLHLRFRSDPQATTLRRTQDCGASRPGKSALGLSSSGLRTGSSLSTPKGLHIDYMPYPNFGPLDHSCSSHLGAHEVEQLILAFKFCLSSDWLVSLNHTRRLEENYITQVNSPSEITEFRPDPYRLTWSACAHQSVRISRTVNYNQE